MYTVSSVEFKESRHKFFRNAVRNAKERVEKGHTEVQIDGDGAGTVWSQNKGVTMKGIILLEKISVPVSLLDFVYGREVAK